MEARVEEKLAMLRGAQEDEELCPLQERRTDESMEVHPLLRGGQPFPPHPFSKTQFEAFVALCDTIFPSLPLESCSLVQSKQPLSKAQLQALETYFLLSAQDPNLSLQFAGCMAKLLKRNQRRLLQFGLWLLASRLGTLVMGGKNACTRTFPFFSKFARLSHQQREGFLHGFARSPISLKQDLYHCFVSFIPWFIFTYVDPFGFNPTFEAIGYSVCEEEDTQIPKKETPSESLKNPTCTATKLPKQINNKCFTEAGFPLPRKETHLSSAYTHAFHSHKQNGSIPKNLPKTESHLEGSLIDADIAGPHLAAELASRGVPLLDDVSHLKELRRNKNPSDVEIGVQCDAVVLGSGAGGAVVAARLAQAGHRVLIFEKGRYFPTAQLSQLEGPSISAMYEESGCLVTEDSRMILLAGATVGGGSTINWCASFKTPRHVREEWAQSHRLDLFESHRYEHAMDAVCARLGVHSEVVQENFQNAALRAGCRALGFHVDNIPRNSPENHHCGFCGLGCKQGKKQSAIVTWLEDAAASGAVVVASCKAEEVLQMQDHKGRRQAVGVVAQVAAKRQRITIYVAARVVVMACGALWTPAILRRSGLCNRSIGRNLHVHPVQLVWGHFEEGKEPAGQCFRGALMTAYSNVAANWDTTGYGALIQCAASQPGITSLSLPWVSGLGFKERMLKFSRTAFFIVLTRDQGGGRVNAETDGRLSVQYQVSNPDKKSSRDGAEKGLRILAAAGACEVGTCNQNGESFMPSGASTSDFEAYLQRIRAESFKKRLSTVTVSAHQMGSCRMGTHSSKSAVKPSGETWEVKGLFVADTSVFPTATGVNPMITVQSMAFCIADSILLYLEHYQKF